MTLYDIIKIYGFVPTDFRFVRHGYAEIDPLEVFKGDPELFDAVFFDADRWYEIDTLADLGEAEKLFGSPCSTAGRSLVAIEPVPSLA